ncbi:MAG: spinster family MFS transporter [Planctomycetota bacterium]
MNSVISSGSPQQRDSSVFSPAYAWYTLIILTFINLINYLDRYVLASVGESVRATFQMGDKDLGTIQSAFFFVYMFASPFAGYLGDRVSRRILIVAGIGTWSLATVATAFADNYFHLWLARALTGIGEAGYGIVAPAILADLFSKESRSRTLSVFYLALPVGTAAGYWFGPTVSQHFGHAPDAPHTSWMCNIGLHEGWRFAFLLGGLPGILLAILAGFLREPPRGGKDMIDGHAALGEFKWSHVAGLLKTRSFIANVFATTAMTFAIGGLATWAPAFVQRVHGYSEKEAGSLFGIIVAICGFLGTISGGFVADFARRWTQAAHFVVPGITLSCSAISLMIALLSSSRESFWGFGGVAVFLLFCNSGPLNAAILNVSLPAVRATAFALMIFTIHLLGDAFSPTLIGMISDHYEPDLGKAESLRRAFLIAPPIVFVGAIVLLIFARWLPRDMQAIDAKIKEASKEKK